MAPDVVCLVESWSSPETVQADLIARRLGFGHSLFEGDCIQDDWVSGIGASSRWPIDSYEPRSLRGEDGAGVGEVLFARIVGDRGPIQLFVVMLDFPLHASAVRQAQVRQLASFIVESTQQRHPVIVCGDFNAGADSDEIRMLTGRVRLRRPWRARSLRVVSMRAWGNVSRITGSSVSRAAAVQRRAASFSRH